LAKRSEEIAWRRPGREGGAHNMQWGDHLRLEVREVPSVRRFAAAEAILAVLKRSPGLSMMTACQVA
jgi:hypothetical protein